MKRGVIKLTRAEVDEIITRVNLADFQSSPLENKFRAAVDSQQVEVPIEVSEDELEFIMDEVIIPDPTIDGTEIKSIRSKIQEMLNGFRVNNDGIN